jgi:hypothetical protein
MPVYKQYVAESSKGSRVRKGRPEWSGMVQAGNRMNSALLYGNVRNDGVLGEGHGFGT